MNIANIGRELSCGNLTYFSVVEADFMHKMVTTFSDIPNMLSSVYTLTEGQNYCL
jgi:hypothetical protein